MKDSVFFKQANLMLRILSLIDPSGDFALKGGTAINFFIRNMPRLSIDIDLAFVHITDRPAACAAINGFSRALSQKIKKHLPRARVTINEKANIVKSLQIQDNESTIQVELNHVIRGCVFPVETMLLCRQAQKEFEMDMKVQILSSADIYGGKICAALDRQHPRDLFDIYLLLQNEGLTEQIRKAFLVYLISHNRPIVELLDPGLLEMENIFDSEFTGITTIDFSYEQFLETRNRLVRDINKALTHDEKQFLVSLSSGEHQWDKLGVGNAHQLPAVKWKLKNIGLMDSKKRKQQQEKLQKHFDKL